QEGNPWLACQSWIGGQGRIRVFRLDERGVWKEQAVLQGDKGENCWHPAIAADNTGRVAVAYDRYPDGDYDIRVAVFGGKNGVRKEFRIATSPKAELRPSVTYQGDRLWIAYEEAPERWGKDSGALALGKGNPLYSARSVRVVCLQADGTLSRPSA